VLPVLPSLMSLAVDMAAGPAFVALAIMPEPRDLADVPSVPEVAAVATVIVPFGIVPFGIGPAGIVPAGMMIVEIGSKIVLRVPGDVAVARAAVARAAALVRALRGLP